MKTEEHFFFDQDIFCCLKPGKPRVSLLLATFLGLVVIFAVDLKLKIVMETEPCFGSII